MKSRHLIIILVQMYFTGFTQDKNVKIDTLLFSKHIGSYPAQKRWFISEHLYTDDEVTGIPRSLDSYRIYKLDFNHSHSLFLRKKAGQNLSLREERYLQSSDARFLTARSYNHYMYAICGLRSGKKVVMFDTDHDKDFYGERIFEFPWDRRKFINGDSTPHAFEVDPFTKVDNTEGNSLTLCYEIFDGTNVVSTCLQYEVQANYEMVPNPAYPSENEWYDYHFVLLVSEYTKAVTSIGNSRFNVYLIPRSSSGYKTHFSFLQGWKGPPYKPTPLESIVDTLLPNTQVVLNMSTDGLRGTIILQDKLVSDEKQTQLSETDISMLDIFTETEYSKSITPSNYNLVHFFGTWCGPCKRDFPTLREISRQNPALHIVGIASEHDLKFSTLREAKFKYMLDWDIIVDKYLLGDDRNLAVQLDISYYPTYVLADEVGKVLKISQDISEILKYEFK